MRSGVEGWNVRVHGVGGPQGPKILGVLFDTDTYTLAPDPVEVPGSAGPVLEQVPADARSRVLRRLDDRGVQAYEWGGLTLGSVLHALWAVFLPLTVLNAAGWAHRRGAGRSSRAVVHVVAALGTVTYVWWAGYLLLDLVGRQWRDRLLAADLPMLAADVVRLGGLPIAHLLFAAALGGLWWANRRSGAAFEGCTLGDRSPDWDHDDRVLDAGFFGHQSSYERLRAWHQAVAVVGMVVVVALGFAPRQLEAAGGAQLSSIGLGLLVLGTAQGLLLTGWWLVALVTGDRVRAGGATLGTVLCHVGFLGVAVLAVEHLGNWPAPVAGEPGIVAGAELAQVDHFFGGLLAGAAAVALLAVVLALRSPGRPGYQVAPTFAGRLVGSAPSATYLLALGFVASFVVFAMVQGRHLDLGGGPTAWPRALVEWYEGYRHTTNRLQEMGSLALGLVPVVVVTVLRRPRKSAAARFLGNVWDVLTFWPRRFHPFAAPPYSERAVPELRWVARRRRRPDRPLVVAGHSQGSVLCLAAVAPEVAGAPGDGPVSLLTFGSPLGKLHGAMFPAYLDDADRAAVAAAVEASGGRWWNLYRSTDAIGGPVVATPPGPSPTWYDKWLPDPRLEQAEDPVPPPPPLERARPWGTVDGHNLYLADPSARRLLEWLRTGADIDERALADA